MLDSFDVPPPVPAPWPEPDDPLDALTEADVAWLDLMADVLPRSMPVDGCSWWTRPWSSWITMEKVRG